tara:strand:+ start:906 stop:1400 length:495 start_codon:yes stop_codon:yes gene_type:complete
MKNTLSILLFSLFLFGFSDEVQRYHIDKTTSPNDTLTYLKYDMSLVNGVIFCEFGDVGLFKDGKRDGVHKGWWGNGQLEWEENYKDGKKVDGLYKSWHKNGEVEGEGNYKDGELDGLWKSWHKNGQLRYEKNYKDGKEDGLRKWWWKNGKLRYEENYKDGKLID